MIEELSMEVSTERIQAPTRVYRRELPGAGYVAIDVMRTDDTAEDGSEVERSRVRLYV